MMLPKKIVKWHVELERDDNIIKEVIVGEAIFEHKISQLGLFGDTNDLVAHKIKIIDNTLEVDGIKAIPFSKELLDKYGIKESEPIRKAAVKRAIDSGIISLPDWAGPWDLALRTKLLIYDGPSFAKEYIITPESVLEAAEVRKIDSIWNEEELRVLIAYQLVSKQYEEKFLVILDDANRIHASGPPDADDELVSEGYNDVEIYLTEPIVIKQDLYHWHWITRAALDAINYADWSTPMLLEITEPLTEEFLNELLSKKTTNFILVNRRHQIRL